MSYTKAYTPTTWVNGSQPALSAENLQNIEDGIDTLDDRIVTLGEIPAHIADEFSSASTYNKADLVYYNNGLYICTTAVETAGAWNASNWSPVTIATVFALFLEAINYNHETAMSAVDDTAASIAPIYSESSTYAIGDYCTQDGQLYKCVFPVETPGAFDSARWEEVSVVDEFQQTVTYATDAQINDIVAIIEGE